ncbi:unnamed protein product [Litomosoides sigmodontis]|uniref:MH2 domain-containing protein n=1 Tax=Litomosoides sigmodontis TaxID=42156 RepID=A0A3P6TCH9_LITSI|nr:unnamed protein product [Litomosoides sigmodontis]
MQNECCMSRMEAACLVGGVGRGANAISELGALSSNSSITNSANPWHTVEQFEREHAIEILEKLEKGDLDDNLWGKIILMEKCRPLVKFRRTTVIIDGGSDEYDGITIGFNHFNADDKGSNDIRHKIGDGVIVKIDMNGNMKAMARGLAPVIAQGWNDPISKCIPEQLIVRKGRLATIKDRLKGITDQQRVEKIFDMRLFNLSIEEELRQSEPNMLKLLLKSCIRIALVKDVATNALKTPCWFMIVNLVALDLLRSKLPSISRLISGAQYLSTQSMITPNELLPMCRNQWRKGSSKFLSENSDEVLENEEMDRIPPSEKHLMANLTVSGNSREVERSSNKSDICQNVKGIRIIDNDVKQELNPEFEKRFEIPSSKLKVQEKLAEDESATLRKHISATRYPSRKTLSQESQRSDHKSNGSEVSVEKILQRKCSSTKEKRTFPSQTDQRHFDKLTFKQNIAAPTMKPQNR